MQKLTISEINKFRILTSKYRFDSDLVTNDYILSLQNIPTENIDTELVKSIFKMLGFSYGGAIWVKVDLIKKAKNIVIKIGDYELANYLVSDHKEIQDIKDGTYPLEIDTFFTPRRPGVKKCKLSSKTSGTLENFRYNCFQKKVYSSNYKNFEYYFRGRGPFVNKDKYYKTLKKLNLPITYDMGILEKIYEEYSDDPLNNPRDISYSHLVKFAEFIEINNIHKTNSCKPFFEDIFYIYKSAKEFPLKTSDRTLQETFIKYSDYYEKTYIKQEDQVTRSLRWINNNLLLGNLSSKIKEILAFTPIILGIATFIASVNLVQITGWNLNFAFSLYSPLRDEILSHILFFAILGCLVFLYLALCYVTVGKIYISILRRIMRIFWVTRLLRKFWFIRQVALIFLTLLGLIAAVYVSRLQLLLGLALFPPIIIVCSVTISSLLDDATNLFHAPKNIFILFSIFGISMQVFFTFSNPSNLYSQSCAYKVLDEELYKYRYYETGNWADKIEIALLPGSSEKWVDGSALQIPTKITVQKSDLRLMTSCTDEFNTWDEAEEKFNSIKRNSPIYSLKPIPFLDD